MASLWTLVEPDRGLSASSGRYGAQTSDSVRGLHSRPQFGMAESRQAGRVPYGRSLTRGGASRGDGGLRCDETEEERLLGGSKVSASAVPISRPGLEDPDDSNVWFSPRSTGPARSAKRKPWQVFPGKVNGLDTRTSRGENVTAPSGRKWKSTPETPEQSRAKRRRTMDSSHERPNPRRSRVSVDLTDDMILDSDQEVELIGSTDAQPTSPPLPSRQSQKSRSRKSSQVSMAEDFGKLPEYESVLRRGDARRQLRNGQRGAFADEVVPGHDAHATEDTFPAQSVRKSGRNQTRLSEDVERWTSHQQAQLQTGQMSPPNEVEHAFGMNRKPTTALEQRPSSRQRGSKHDGPGQPKNVYTAPFQRIIPDLNANTHEERGQRRINRRLERSSDDELANDDSNYAIRSVSPEKPQSPYDIQKSKFTRTVPRPNESANMQSSGGQSGWRFQFLYSNLLPEGIETSVLHPASRECYIVRHRQRVRAIEMSKMTEIHYSADKIVLRGAGGVWAALQFIEVPERLGCSAHLKKNFKMTSKDVGGKTAIDELFRRTIEEGAGPATKTSSIRAQRPLDEELKFLEAKKNARINPPSNGPKSQSAAPQSGSARLISLLKSSGQLAEEDDIFAEPQSPKPVKAASPTDDVFAIGDDGKVLGFLDRPNRRSGRLTRTTSRYFQNTVSDEDIPIVIPTEERYSHKFGLGPRWEFSITYPFLGKDRATVVFDDLERLDDGEFLNDNLIEFYLRWVRQQLIDKGEYDEGQVHFFNTFFYAKLASGGRGINHAAVQTWTRKVDIFDYDFVVVPVNENAHWYVCIICNLPKLKRKFESNDASGPSTVHDRGEDKPDVEIVDDPERTLARSIDLSIRPSPRPTAVTTPTRERQSESDEWPDSAENPQGQNPSPFVQDAGPSQESVDLIRSEGLFKNANTISPLKKDKRRKSGPPPRRYDPAAPIIITLDSLSLSHLKTTNNLKDYIIAEGLAKHSFDIPKEEIKAMNVTRGIPRQQNFCDCGLFLLGYMHKFLLGPRDFVTKILRSELDEERDWPDMDPSKLRTNMRNLLQNIYLEQLPEQQKRKKGKKKRVTELPSEPDHAPASSSAIRSDNASLVMDEMQPSSAVVSSPAAPPDLNERDHSQEGISRRSEAAEELIDAPAAPYAQRRGHDSAFDWPVGDTDEMLHDMEDQLPEASDLLSSRVVRRSSKPKGRSHADSIEDVQPERAKRWRSPPGRGGKSDHTSALERLKFPTAPSINGRTSPRRGRWQAG